MKKIREYGRVIVALIMVIVISALLIWAAISKAAPIDRYNSSWHLIRAVNNEDGASFAAVYDLTGVGTTNGDFDSKDSSTVANGGPYHIRSAVSSSFSEKASPGQKWMFAFCGQCFNNTNDTFSFDLVGWSRDNGMMQVIAEGDCVLGTQAVVKYPNDGSDALGTVCSLTGVTYTNGTTTYVDTDDAGGFDGVAVGMLARVTGTNITNGIYQVTTVTDANTIICSGTASTDDTTDATVQINPSFWVDTINLDETTKWQASGSDPNSLQVINSGDNEVACLVVDLTGLEWIQFVIYDADAATNEEAGQIAVYGRRY